MMVKTPDSDIIALLNEYSPIVKHIARSACRSSSVIDFTDLCQVGDITVLQAVKVYDPSCGASIRSFVSRVVRNEIYREAARFLGVFTVDFRVTPLAAKVHKLYTKGHSDEEIAVILSKSNDRKFDSDHVRDLRIAYGRRENVCIEETTPLEDIELDECTIHDLLTDVAVNDTEVSILNYRILGSLSAKETADILKIKRRSVYEIENILKQRIKIAIEDMKE